MSTLLTTSFTRSNVSNWLKLGVVVLIQSAMVYVEIDETHGDKSRESVRVKVARYLERAEELKKYLKKKTSRNTVTEGGGSSSKSKKKR